MVATGSIHLGISYDTCSRLAMYNGTVVCWCLNNFNNSYYEYKKGMGMSRMKTCKQQSIEILLGIIP